MSIKQSRRYLKIRQQSLWDALTWYRDNVAVEPPKPHDLEIILSLRNRWLEVTEDLKTLR